MTAAENEYATFTFDQLCVAEKLDDVARNGRAIRAVMSSRYDLSQPVEETLSELHDQGAAERVDVHENYLLTPIGRKRLAATQNWEFEVSDVFEIEGRDVPFAIGTVLGGLIRPEDWFRNSRAGSGIVKAIEFARVDRGEAVVLGCDGDEVIAGDRLSGWIPMA